ncbi:CRISPR system precrRNA processing endoribonuclease RAMP protein Cas6 [Desulfobacterota bacterium M19]
MKRYSNRQRQAMMIGGIRGEISYRGEEIAEFIPLLSYCQQTHLGKQTSFGLGRIAVETGKKQ